MMSRPAIELPHTIRGREYDVSFAELRQKARVCSHLRAAFGPGVARFNEHGGVTLSLATGEVRHIGPSAMSTLDALQRQGDVEREIRRSDAAPAAREKAEQRRRRRGPLPLVGALALQRLEEIGQPLDKEDDL